MRRDMFEVIIERPRLGRADTGRKGRRGERTDRAFERAPKSMGMGREGRSKSLNENLAPLRRFLRSRVGRPWTAVRSEMCAVLSMSSAVQKHVIDHVRQWVEENPLIVDGIAYHPGAYGGVFHPVTNHPRWSCFFVCPRTGLLREAKPGRPRALDLCKSAMDARAGLGQEGARSRGVRARAEE